MDKPLYTGCGQKITIVNIGCSCYIAAVGTRGFYICILVCALVCTKVCAAGDFFVEGGRVFVRAVSETDLDAVANATAATAGAMATALSAWNFPSWSSLFASCVSGAPIGYGLSPIPKDVRQEVWPDFFSGALYIVGSEHKKIGRNTEAWGFRVLYEVGEKKDFGVLIVKDTPAEQKDRFPSMTTVVGQKIAGFLGLANRRYDNLDFLRSTLRVKMPFDSRAALFCVAQWTIPVDLPVRLVGCARAFKKCESCFKRCGDALGVYKYKMVITALLTRQECMEFVEPALLFGRFRVMQGLSELHFSVGETPLDNRMDSVCHVGNTLETMLTILDDQAVAQIGRSVEFKIVKWSPAKLRTELDESLSLVSALKQHVESLGPLADTAAVVPFDDGFVKAYIEPIYLYGVCLGGCFSRLYKEGFKAKLRSGTAVPKENRLDSSLYTSQFLAQYADSLVMSASEFFSMVASFEMLGSREKKVCSVRKYQLYDMCELFDFSEEFESSQYNMKRFVVVKFLLTKDEDQMGRWHSRDFVHKKTEQDTDVIEQLKTIGLCDQKWPVCIEAPSYNALEVYKILQFSDWMVTR